MVECENCSLVLDCAVAVGLIRLMKYSLTEKCASLTVPDYLSVSSFHFNLELTLELGYESIADSPYNFRFVAS